MISPMGGGGGVGMRVFKRVLIFHGCVGHWQSGPLRSCPIHNSEARYTDEAWEGAGRTARRDLGEHQRDSGLRSYWPFHKLQWEACSWAPGDVSPTDPHNWYMVTIDTPQASTSHLSPILWLAHFAHSPTPKALTLSIFKKPAQFCRIGSKHTSLSIQHYSRESNRRLSAPGLALQDQEKTCNHKKSPQREQVWSRHFHRKGLRELQNLQKSWKKGISLLKKPVSKNWRRWLLLQKWRQQSKTSKNMKTQGNIPPHTHTHKNTKIILTPKEMELCECPIKNSK